MTMNDRARQQKPPIPRDWTEKPGVHKVYDDRLAYPGFGGCRSLCHLRVYQSRQETVVIATELDENPGTSITNVCEELATAVCRRFGIRYDRLTWIEHHPDRDFVAGQPLRKEDFDRVTFTPTRLGLTAPHWHPIPKEDIEQRIGGKLEPVPDRGRAAAR